MRYPLIITIDSAVTSATHVHANIGGQWVPARPEGYASFRSRVRAAWLVFTGKADALTWGGGQ